jgi:uncharacterized protein (TIGR02679 family)
MSLSKLATELATRPDLAMLWTAVHRRLEANGGSVDGATVHVASPSADERRAIDRLLGRRSRGSSIRVVLDELDRLLSERTGSHLTDIVCAAVGPIRDRPGERSARTAARALFWEGARRHQAIGRHAGLRRWLDATEAAARITSGFEASLVTALDVLGQLPSPMPIARGRLAAVAVGDSHALDEGRRAATLVLDAWANLANLPPPTTAAERRAMWRDAGVYVDETSSTVLTLGLRIEATGPLTEAAKRWAATGVALPITLAAATAEPWRLAAGTVVWCCENPSVLEAAASRFGMNAPPMVCVLGNPSVAARTLIDQLIAGGAELWYHGDFGSGGLAIGNVVIGELGAKPWRFTAPDHAAALAELNGQIARLPRLRGRVPAASWDPTLEPAVSRSGVEVEEEHVLDSLLTDLRTDRPASGSRGAGTI